MSRRPARLAGARWGGRRGQGAGRRRCSSWGRRCCWCRRRSSGSGRGRCRSGGFSFVRRGFEGGLGLGLTSRLCSGAAVARDARRTAGRNIGFHILMWALVRVCSSTLWEACKWVDSAGSIYKFKVQMATRSLRLYHLSTAVVLSTTV